MVQKILARKILSRERGENDEEDGSDSNEGSAAVKGVILMPTRELCNQVAKVSFYSAMK